MITKALSCLEAGDLPRCGARRRLPPEWYLLDLVDAHHFDLSPNAVPRLVRYRYRNHRDRTTTPVRPPAESGDKQSFRSPTSSARRRPPPAHSRCLKAGVLATAAPINTTSGGILYTSDPQMMK